MRGDGERKHQRSGGVGEVSDEGCLSAAEALK